MANKYLITVVLSMGAGVLGIALLHVVWPALEPLPEFMQYALTGVGGAVFAIYLADATRAVLPLPFEMGSEGRPHATSASRGQWT